MTTIRGEMTPVTQHNLLVPDVAMSTVSRSEIVNLVVVQYMSKVQAEIAALDTRLEELNTLATSAWETAYRAWYAQITASAHERLEPWRAAVAVAVDAPVTVLHSTGLPMPQECRYNFAGVNAPTDSERDRKLTRIPDVIQHWTTIGKLGADFTVPITLNYYDNGQVPLPAFKMRWGFAREKAVYGDDFHSLTILMDVTPDDTVRPLIEAAMAATLDYQHTFSKKHALIKEISDDNVKSLERRALARLTEQTLAEGIVLPVLNG